MPALPGRSRHPLARAVALVLLPLAAVAAPPRVGLGVPPPPPSAAQAQAGFRAGSTPGARCHEVVVGGGWAGVYFAYRRSSAAAAEEATKMCIFEASSRFGGRTLSVAIEGTEFTLDVGAYRFSPDMHLPGDLILHDLRLPTACYEPHCPDAASELPPPFLFNYSAPLRRIVDPDTGLPNGYVTAIHAMLDKMRDMGVQIYSDTRLVDLVAVGGALTLQLEGEQGRFAVQPTTVLLNLPRNKLFGLPSVEAALGARRSRILKCVKFDMPKQLFPHVRNLTPSSAMTKAYLYYEDAWWHTRLNQTAGSFPANAFSPRSTSTGVDVGIHWNDGPVVCRHEGGRKACHGFLEVFYAVSNETFFASVSGAPVNPFGTLRRSQPGGAERLDRAHAAVMEALAPLLKAKNVLPGDIAARPTQLVVGTWSRPNAKHPLGQGFTAPTKVYYSPTMSGSLADACAVDGLTEREFQAVALEPFAAWKGRVFMANNDWVAQDVTFMYGDWAEESLLQAERALRRLGAARPSWLDAAYYQEKVARAVERSSLARAVDGTLE